MSPPFGFTARRRGSRALALLALAGPLSVLVAQPAQAVDAGPIVQTVQNIVAQTVQDPGVPPVRVPNPGGVVQTVQNIVAQTVQDPGVPPVRVPNPGGVVQTVQNIVAQTVQDPGVPPVRVPNPCESVSCEVPPVPPATVPPTTCDSNIDLCSPLPPGSHDPQPGILPGLAAVGTDLPSGEEVGTPAAVPVALPPAIAELAGEATADSYDSEALIGDALASPSGPRRGCVFFTRGDEVHISSSEYVASGHGWWDDPCRSGYTATITVQLQQYYSDGKWRNAGASSVQSGIPAGGGAGKRTTARKPCYTTTLVGWRSIVDVDIEGVPDGNAKLTTKGVNLRCRY